MLRQLLSTLVAGLVVFTVAARVDASVFTGGGAYGEHGETVAAKATFTISGTTLTITLENTTTHATASNGSVITGVTFDIRPDFSNDPSDPNYGTLSFDPTGNPSLTVGSNIFVDGNTGNGIDQTVAINNSQVLGGSYSSQLTNSSLGDFGVATTGGNGIFAAGPITLGNGGPDYGLVAAGTFTDGGSAQDRPNSLPFVQTSVTFTFNITGTRTLHESNIVGASFLVGTAGSHFAGTLQPSNDTTPAPEPTTMAIWGAGLGLAGFARFRRQTR